jgi:hypothetical protein
MHRHIFSLVGLLLTISTAAADADQSRPQTPTRPARQHEARSATAMAAVAVANARLAAIIDQGGVVIRSKGVQSVTNPFIGTYCIRPTSASGVNPRNVVPVLTVDFDGTSYNEAMAQYSDVGTDCPAGTIEVLTFDDRNHDAFYLDSNRVGFTIVVN